MPALNFKNQFAPDVESGKKRQTIRTKRKHPIEVGDKLYLYTGMRTKACRKLDETYCRTEKEISIGRNYLKLEGMPMPDRVMDKIARADGFEDFEGLRDFIEETHGFPFHGQIIYW